MPLMRRLSKKAERIAHSILGTPPNMNQKKTREQKRVDRILLSQDTIRVR